MDRNVDAFLAVVRSKTLTEASERIGLTQPSVTKRIANLERTLGAALFERHPRGMTLTAAGQVFFERAKRIEAEYRASIEEVAIIGSAGVSVLKVGAGPVFHLNCVAGLFKHLKTKFPDLRFELSTDVKLPTSELLNEGIIDVYMGVITPEHMDDTIHVKYVTQVEHGIVLRADDPHAAKLKVDPAKLRDYNWVIFAIDPETERSIQEYSVPGGLDLPIIDVRTTSFSTGLQLVQQGNFVMSAPLQLVSVIEAVGLTIRPFAQSMPKREAGIHVRKSALGYGVIEALLEFFDDFDFG
ncbi:LysR family transcriptional regulator [Litoreibacter sp.]|nr:LysR family transcriptional regulator [Litoreibacter sp.]